MGLRSYFSEGVILARRNFSEADRILVVYSKHYGKLSLLAKGVRKPKSRKRGALEVFSQIKFSASRGKNLDLVTEVEIINRFTKIRENLKKAAVAYFIVEVVSRLTPEEEKNIQFYDLVINYLTKIGKSTKLKKLREDFIRDSLVILGFWPKGKRIDNPDLLLEEIVERELSSKRVGKRILL